MGESWHTWSDLGGRDHIAFAIRPLPKATGGAVHVRRGHRAAIVIDPGLTQIERRCALAHELVHDERGGGCDHEVMPDSWAAVVSREEQRVDDIAVARLVPADDLMRFCVEMETGCVHVTAHHVAEFFHVTASVARRALELQDRRIEAALARVRDGQR